MLRFAANLTMLFKEVPFLERFSSAAACGFAGVEYLFPYEYDPAELHERLRENSLQQVLFNLPPGDWNTGDRGTAALPHRVEEFREGLHLALRYGRELECTRLHAMAGVIPAGADRAECEETFLSNVRYAADAASSEGITIVLEALNTRDVPGYFFSSQTEALELVRKIGRSNVAVQLDYYHAQIMDGDLTRLTETLADSIGHVQIASVPDRHEPDEGEINYRHIFATLERIGYAGWIGCEYNPRGTTEDGLGWILPYISNARSNQI